MNLGGFDLMLDPHYIGKLYLSLFGSFKLHTFSFIEFDKKSPGNGLGKLITCFGDHSVGDYTAVPCDRDITCPRSHIHKSYIEHPVLVGHSRSHGSDRLER